MPTILKSAWRHWRNFAVILGNAQMIILLSLIYWTFLVFLAIPFRLLSDPLALRNASRVRWAPRHPVSDVLDSMRRQG